jgi:hypothetical protein
MKSFKDDNELFQFVEDYIVRDKLPSFQKDVDHCLSLPYAEFPAILYCFSIIDLLASLYCGQTKGDTACNARTYMKDMMHYTADQCTLLQQVFRHKLVQLGTPKLAYKLDDKIVTGHYRTDGPEKHLKLVAAPPKGYVQPTSKIRQDITHVFWIGIKQLSEDIIQSFQSPGGYYEKLKVDQTLKTNFDNAVCEMFSVNK